MSILYTVDVFCDRCSNWMRGVSGHKAPSLTKTALKRAKANGWSRNVNSTFTDLCPDCLQKSRRDQGASLKETKP